jgi:lipopolysaccharide/colanic/teichoic acid biosynthesis glycosyltransferase/predicted ABC-type ATPase
LKEPFLLIVAGPNGAGKTTLTRWLRNQQIDFGEYINADDIAAGLQGPEDARVREAQRIADVRREQCIAARRSFTFETVMSHPSKVDILKRAKEAGFFVQLFFVGTDDSEINIARVALRVRLGGHDVPEEKITSRWLRTMDLLAQAIRSVDAAFVFDNSSAEQRGGPRLVFQWKAAEETRRPKFQFFRTIPDWVWQYVIIPLDINPRAPPSYAIDGHGNGGRGNAFIPAPTTGNRRAAAHDHITSYVASLDAALIICASVFASLSYYYSVVGTSPDLLIALRVGTIAAAIYLIVGRSWGCYDLQFLLADRPRLGRIALAWMTVFLVLLLFLFLLKISLSRGPMIVFGFIGLLLLLSFRLGAVSFLHSAISRRFFVGHGAVIIGEHDELAALNSTDLLYRFGIQELARVTLDQATPEAARNAIGNVDRAIETARNVAASGIVVAVPWSRIGLLELVRHRLLRAPLRVQLLPDDNVRSILPGTDFLVELQREPLSATERFKKRVFDLVVTSGMVVIFTPLFLLTALSIKLDSPGPLLFRQRRRAFNGSSFLTRQFRTMKVSEDGPQIAQPHASSPRVTAIGSVLRSSGIDVLPQLFNVLSGEMSLVGPRAGVVGIEGSSQAGISDFAFKHHIKPGFTGLSQLGVFRSGRIEDIEGRFEADLWYINNWSLWLDIRIALAALWAVPRVDAY